MTHLRDCFVDLSSFCFMIVIYNNFFLLYYTVRRKKFATYARFCYKMRLPKQGSCKFLSCNCTLHYKFDKQIIYILKEFQCQNHVRVILKLPDGSLYVCSTNAYSPVVNKFDVKKFLLTVNETLY